MRSPICFHAGAYNRQTQMFPQGSLSPVFRTRHGYSSKRRRCQTAGFLWRCDWALPRFEHQHNSRGRLRFSTNVLERVSVRFSNGRQPVVGSDCWTLFRPRRGGTRDKLGSCSVPGFAISEMGAAMVPAVGLACIYRLRRMPAQRWQTRALSEQLAAPCHIAVRMGTCVHTPGIAHRHLLPVSSTNKKLLKTWSRKCAKGAL